MRHLHTHRLARISTSSWLQSNWYASPWREEQWHVGRRRPSPALICPSPGIATDSIVAAVITTLAQFLEHADQCELLAGRLGRVARQQRFEHLCPSSELRSGLDLTFVFEGCLARPQHFADRVPRDPEVPRDLLDRLAFDEVLAPNPRNRFHNQHPLTTRFESKQEACNGHTSGGHFWTPIPRLRGLKLHAD